MRRIFIDPYSGVSSGARALAENLSASRIRQTESRYRPRRSDIVINWGNSNPSDWIRRVGRDGRALPTIVNDFNAVAVASNKLTTFTRLFGHAISFPEFTTDYATAKDWVGDGALIVSRSLLRASGGRGMAVSEEPQKSVDGVPTQMWVKYKRKSREYRVHVFKGRAIDTQQKRRMSGFDADAQIRNRDNGWVYTRRGVLEHPEIPMVQAQAILALTVLELDFGAVDVIYSAKKNRCWVLEVNCAPGLEGQTIESYSNAIRGFANENNSERR